MTSTAARAHARTTKQDLRRRVLALALFVVLVWYTVVSPSYTAAPPRATDSESPDAEEREVEARAGRDFVSPRVARALTPRADGFEVGGVDELDWPEIIGDD